MLHPTELNNKDAIKLMLNMTDILKSATKRSEKEIKEKILSLFLSLNML